MDQNQTSMALLFNPALVLQSQTGSDRGIFVYTSRHVHASLGMDSYGSALVCMGSFNEKCFGARKK